MLPMEETEVPLYYFSQLYVALQLSQNKTFTLERGPSKVGVHTVEYYAAEKRNAMKSPSRSIQWEKKQGLAVDTILSFSNKE